MTRSRLSFVVPAAALSLSGCLFLPAIDDDGYVACESDADCSPDKACIAGFGRCAPPPWNDDTFRERRALVVTNPAATPLPAGTAIPVPLGDADDVLPFAALKPDRRFTQFDTATGTWSVTGVFQDVVDGQGLDADTVVVWVPTAAAVPPGASALLAFLEQDTEAGAITIKEDPASVFALFDDIDAFPVDGDDLVFVDAPGAAAPVVAEGNVQVGDNQKVVWKTGLAPPFSLTFRARVEGLLCEQVYLGVTGSASPSFDFPMAGFFIETDLQAAAQYAPITTAQRIDEIAPPKVIAEVPTALHRFTVVVDTNALRFMVDDVDFEKDEALVTAFEDKELFATVEVDGACSVFVDAVWMTPLPVALPSVTAQAPVLFNPTF